MNSKFASMYKGRNWNRKGNVIAANRARASATRTANMAATRAAAAVAGMTRTGGFYRRFGRQAAEAGLIPEKKFFDGALAFNFDSTGENVTPNNTLNNIGQGDTESTRDGRLATIKSIHIRARVTFAGGVVPGDYCFLWLVLDTQANGAGSTFTDMFTTTNAWSTFVALNNSGRFKILKKWRIAFNTGAGVATAFAAVTKHIDWFKRCDIRVDWSGTTGAITEIRSNNLVLYAGSGGLSDDGIALDGAWRLRFMG